MSKYIIQAYKLAIKYNDMQAIRKIKSIEIRYNKSRDTLQDYKYILNYVKR